MKTIIKIIKHQPEDKCVSVKICRLHSHKSIDDYDSKRVEYGGLNFTDNETFVDSLVQKSKHRVENQDDKESILDNNIPEEVSGELNIVGLVGKVIEAKINYQGTRLLKVRRIEL